MQFYNKAQAAFHLLVIVEVLVLYPLNFFCDLLVIIYFNDIKKTFLYIMYFGVQKNNLNSVFGVRHRKIDFYRIFCIIKI